MSAKHRADALAARHRGGQAVPGGAFRPSPLGTSVVSAVAARRPRTAPAVEVAPEVRRLDDRGRFAMAGIGQLMNWAGQGPLAVAIDGPWVRLSPATAPVRDFARDVARFDGKADRITLPRGLRAYLGGKAAGDTIVVLPVPATGDVLVADLLAVIALPTGAEIAAAAPVAPVLPLITVTK